MIIVKAAVEWRVMVDDLLAARRRKLALLREGGDAYPNDFRRTHSADELAAVYGAAQDKKEAGADDDNSDDGDNGEVVAVAGRVVLKRMMGKAGFLTIRDSTADAQLYFRKDALGDAGFAAAAELDLGDIIGARGTLFTTRTGELTVRAESLRVLAKSLLPPPEKFHGIGDTEVRYRRRYLSLMSSPSEREVFVKRAKLLRHLRDFLDARGFLEVETPILQAIPGGAAARPFITKCNALDCDFYLRIAQELHLKRLLVGGFDRVYEMNRVFRNEGVSVRHNPEFTMLEFNAAYQTCADFIPLVEEMLHSAAVAVCGKAQIPYQGGVVDFSRPFARLTPAMAILQAKPEWTTAQLDDKEFLLAQLATFNVDTAAVQNDAVEVLRFELFERCAEHTLINPTFIVEYPAAISPLAKTSAANPAVAERFELFAAGRELVNGFSEQNDPQKQAEVFRAQNRLRQGGDFDAMHYDDDYIRALEHGLPPNAGGGVGIDRLVMLLTDSPAIRDVILFPQLRGGGNKSGEGGESGAGGE